MRLLTVLIAIIIFIPHAWAQSAAETAQCRGMLGQVTLSAGVDPDKICKCMQEKSAVKNESDIDAMMRGMTTCLQEQAASIAPQSGGKSATQASQKQSVGNSATQSSQKQSAATAPARPANKNIHYDPKTGTWSN